MDADAFTRLQSLMATLRAQCPWDRVQTHATLRRHLLEEAYEVLDALDHLDESSYDDLCEELGDLLFQVVFHAHLASETGQFDLGDVADGITNKLIARHPDIFNPGDKVDPSPSASARWERDKMSAKGRSSVMDGIPATLPALLYATKVLSKAQVVKPEVVAEPTHHPQFANEAELGDQLMAIVHAARDANLDPEAALRRAARALEAATRAAEAGSSDS